MTRYLFMLAIGLATFTTACKKEAIVDGPPVDNPDDKPSQPAGVPTEVGKPVGVKIIKRIGPGGGNMSFQFGRTSSQGSRSFELNFPQGCFEKEVEISVQPIENMSPNGTGLAFRISTSDPNTAMKKPAELEITEDDIPWPNKPEIHISVQDPVIRVWRGAKGRKDAATGRRKFKIHRLADWALFEIITCVFMRKKSSLSSKTLSMAIT